MKQAIQDAVQDAEKKGLITVYKAIRLEGNFKQIMKQLDELNKRSK